MLTTTPIQAWRDLRGLLAALLVVLAIVPAQAFHFPWDQGHDVTQSNDPPPPGPDDRSPNDPDCNLYSTNSPVYVATGQAFWRATDVVLRGRPYIGIYRVYNCADPVVGLFGNGWSVDFDIALYPANSSGVIQRIFKAPNGKRFVYTRQDNGAYKAPEGRFESIVEGANTVTMTAPGGQRNVFALDGRLLQRVDANGNAVSFRYDGFGRVVGMSDANGRSLSLIYGAQGLISAVTDHTGRIWRYAYDTNGNLVSVTNPAGGVSRYGWQKFRPAGDAQQYSQLTSVTDPGGVLEISFTYDTNNQVTSYTEGANRISYTRSSFNTKDAGSVSVRDSLNVATSFTYGALGLVTRRVDGIGGVTSFEYDANGRLTQVTDAAGRVWRSVYDNLGRVTSTTNPLGQVRTIQYSGIDPRPVRLTSPSGRVLAFSRDTRGNLLAATNPAGGMTRISYNAQGDATSIINALNQTTQIVYNAIGLPLRVTDALGRQTATTYDAVGRATAITNAAGETTRLAYDALDRITTVVDALNQTTSFAYDAAGRLITVTDPKGAVTRFEYDSFGRRSAEVAPDGRRISYTWRADNLLAAVTWPDDTTLSYEYDNNKRLVREMAGSELVSYSYDAVNQLISASGPSGTVSFSYDGAGRVVSESNGGRTNAITRNADGERIRLEYLGVSQTYTRDVRGLITHINSPAGTFNFEFDALGRRTQLTYPNGSTTRYVFDGAGQLTKLTHAGAFKASYVNTYDAAGRVTNFSGDGTDWTYTYDALGRLTRASQGASVFAYTLDAVGNILGGGRSYDSNNRLVSDANKNYRYDQRGNLTLEQDRASGARTSYVWNHKNQLLQVQFFPDAASSTPTRILLYSYDPLGRRVSKTDNGVVQRFVYDGHDLVGILGAGNTMLATNVFSGQVDEPLAVVGDGNTKFLHANYLGSIVAVSQGAVLTHTYRYGPYGQTLAGSSPDVTPFRYTGREKDTDTLYFYRARYYNSTTGQFISADPVGLLGGINRYSYVGARPTNFVDPSGNIPIDTIWDALNVLYDLYTGNKCDLALDLAAMAVPYLPAGVSKLRYLDDIGDAAKGFSKADSVIAETLAGKGNFTSATKLSADELLEAGEKFLGPGYKEIGQPGSGVFRSADGTRQFRIDNGSITGGHNPGVPHGHLEVYQPGATKPSANNHIPFYD